MNEQIEEMLKEALEVETPEPADACIRAAIHIEAAARRRWRRLRWLAAAAALVLLLGGGLWRYGSRYAPAVPREAVFADEGEIMLEIIDMAEPVDIEAFQVAQL